MTVALAATHLFWPFVQYTPFLFGFGAAVTSSRVGGRHAGLFAVVIGAFGYALFPPPVPTHAIGRLVIGFVVITGIGSWLVARRYEIEAELRGSQDLARRSERRLQAIIDAQPACVKLVSSDGRLLDMNRAGLDMIGSDDLTQVMGQPVATLIHPDDRLRYLEMHGAVIRGAARRLEFRVVGLTGGERWVDSRAVPFDLTMDGSAPERAVLSVTSDITERKQLEEQLRTAQHMEAVGRLAGGVAHDFNNVLTSIAGYTDFVLATFDESDVRRSDLIEVQKAAMRAAGLTRQLLAFSRRQILSPKVLDMNALVTEVHRLLQRTIGEDIELMLQLDPALQPVRADPSQIEQVAINLAVNARDAMPQGGKLRFATEMVEVGREAGEGRTPMAPGHYVRLTVADTGTGIPADIQEHIFEPFFTTKGRHKGTGLGLASVYGTVKQSGGYVWVTSQVGLGTSFHIYLPAVADAVEPTERSEPSHSVMGGSETLLLAEDDPAVRQLASNALRQCGYTVLEASDGEEALRMVRGDRRRHIQLLVTDVVMPGLGGRELAAHVALERPEMRVLYTTGYVETVATGPDWQDGTPLLAKPFLPGDLIRRVRSTLDLPAKAGNVNVSDAAVMVP